MKVTPVKILTVYLPLENSLRKIGRLAVKTRRIYFEYDADFLSSGLNISPFQLPVRPGLLEGDSALFEGLPGVFNDSLPDGWGRLLMDRQLRRQHIEPSTLTPLDRLAHVGQRGMGALLYEPDYSASIDHRSRLLNKLELDRLAAESLQIMEGDSDEVLSELFALNGSSAGARPKVMVGVNKQRNSVISGVDDLSDEYEHWMVKFPSTNDPKDICAIEYAYSLMAKTAGIEMPSTHLFSTNKGIGYFGVKRFDRMANQRIHMHTACGLLHADFRLPSLDYKDLLIATRTLTKDQREVDKMLRLAIFNVLAHNRDDHSKNFSFLMDSSGRWRLAPAYDLTFSSGPAGEHSTMVMGEGKSPQRTHLIKLATQVSIKKVRANEVFDQVQNAVSQWHSFAETAGVSSASKKYIGKLLTQ